jgi:hypothetical protein
VKGRDFQIMRVRVHYFVIEKTLVSVSLSAMFKNEIAHIPERYIKSSIDPKKYWVFG